MLTISIILYYSIFQSVSMRLIKEQSVWINNNLIEISWRELLTSYISTRRRGAYIYIIFWTWRILNNIFLLLVICRQYNRVREKIANYIYYRHIHNRNEIN